MVVWGFEPLAFVGKLSVFGFPCAFVQVVPDLVRRLDNIEKEGRMVRTEDLPGLQEVSEFVSLIFNAELTKMLGSLKKSKAMLVEPALL